MLAQLGSTHINDADIDFKEIKSLRAVTTDNVAPELSADIDALVSDRKYEDLTKIISGKTTIRIVGSKKNRTNSHKNEMLIVVEGDSGVLFMQVLGKIDLSDILANIKFDI
jgi:hypothetical protein